MRILFAGGVGSAQDGPRRAAPHQRTGFDAALLPAGRGMRAVGLFLRQQDGTLALLLAEHEATKA